MNRRNRRQIRVDSPKYFSIRNPKSQIEGNQKSSDKENESRSLSEKRNEKTSEVEKSCNIWMRENILKRNDWNPEHKQSDEPNHIPGEFVDDDKESENRNNRSENKSEIRTENNRSDICHDGSDRRARISGENENSEKKKEPSDNNVSKFESPSRSGFFSLFFRHEEKVVFKECKQISF